MSHFHSSRKAFVVSILVGFVLSACALGRSEIEVKTPSSTAASGTVAVKITEVLDSRVFTAKPSDPSEPSLEIVADLSDSKITARAVGRKRNGFGAALGDVVLPEGATVANLVRDAAQSALQDKGYRVVSEASPDYADALPLALDIDKFWAWIFLSNGTLSFKSKVIMTGDPLVGAAPISAEGVTDQSVAFATESAWTETIQIGLADLIVKMKARIKAPSEIGR